MIKGAVPTSSKTATSTPYMTSSVDGNDPQIGRVLHRQWRLLIQHPRCDDRRWQPQNWTTVLYVMNGNSKSSLLKIWWLTPQHSEDVVIAMPIAAFGLQPQSLREPLMIGKWLPAFKATMSNSLWRKQWLVWFSIFSYGSFAELMNLGGNGFSNYRYLQSWWQQ